MAKDYVFLKYLDIPFSYVITTLLLGNPWENQIFDTNIITTLLLLGGVIATTLELLNPLNYLLFFIIDRIFKNRIIITSGIGTPKQNGFNISYIGRRAFYSEIISKQKDKLIGFIYFLIVLFISIYKIYNLSYNITPFDNHIIICFLGIISALVFILIINEFIVYPIKIYITSIYLLKVEGNIATGNDFSIFSKALDDDDWVTARYCARNSFTKKDYAPEPADFMIWENLSQALSLSFYKEIYDSIKSHKFRQNFATSL